MEISTIRAKFLPQNPTRLAQRHTISYDIEKLSSFHLKTFLLWSSGGETDYEHCLKIKDKILLCRVLVLNCDSEFDLTNDSELFVSARIASKNTEQDF
jgi:hypothetical protein